MPAHSKEHTYSRYLGLFLLLGIFYGGCSPTPEKIDRQQGLYEFELSPGFKELPLEADNTPEDNVTTYEGVELGRHLFYDERLSKNNTISCASCHKQEHAFSDPRQFSEGFDGSLGKRNSMSIVNLKWHGRFFWDGRAATLEEQVLMPIQDPTEMGMELDALVSKLKQIKLYKELFEDAFGSSDISSKRISMALSQFVRSIVSDGALYDDVYRINPRLDQQFKQHLTDQEFWGYRLFTNHPPPHSKDNDIGSPSRGAFCADCHSGDLLTNNAFGNNGLDSLVTDKGYGEVSGKKKHMGLFKTPTLRNIALTAPYMHDGRFATLEEVVDHYDEHVLGHPNLTPEFNHIGNVKAGSLDLTQSEKDALVAYLKTFTDYELIDDPKFSNPFDE